MIFEGTKKLNFFWSGVDTSRQLLSIARATAANPELLLLDEITANLDANTERDVLTALKGVSENRTVISISHRVTARTGRVINC